jgi:hypothetical protein
MDHASRPFLNVDFSPLTRPEALAAVVARSENLAPFVYVATPNVAHIVMLHEDLAARKPLYVAWRDSGGYIGLRTCWCAISWRCCASCGSATA